MSDELYSKVTRRMWRDEVFWSWKAAPPNTHTLWFYLLTGLHNGRIPGLFVLSVATMADDLGWDRDATAECLQEILDSNRAKMDPRTKLVWLPGALHHNKPTSANQITGWANEWKLLPSCPLLREAATYFRALLARIASSYVAAFDGLAAERPSNRGQPSGTRSQSHRGRDPKVIGDEIPKSSGTQEQEQEQEQNQDLSCDADREPDTKRAREATPAAAAPPLVDRLPDGHPNAMPTTEDIQAMLRKHRCLAAMADDPESVDHLQALAISGGKRNREVDRAITDWVAKESPKWKHIPVEDLCGKVGLFVSWAKRLRDEPQGMPPAPDELSPEANATLAVYLFAFSKANNGEERELDAGDRKAAQKVYALAAQGVPKAGKGATPITVLKHKLREYMADPDTFVARKRYPLALLESRWGQYTLPAPWRAPEQPEEPALPRQSAAEHLANLKAFTATLPGAKETRRPPSRFAAPPNPPPPAQTPHPPVKANHGGANGHPAPGSDPTPGPPPVAPQEPAGPEPSADAPDPGTFSHDSAGPEPVSERPPLPTITVRGVEVDAELAAIAPELVGRTMGRRRLREAPPGLVATPPPAAVAQAPPTRAGFLEALGGIGGGPRQITPEVAEYARRRNGGMR